jgi:tetratricopeptide (TPR) repeat protein
LRRAIELDPELVEARVALAQALARGGSAEEAREQQAEVRRLNAARADASRAMILVETAGQLQQSGDVATAAARLREAVTLAPGFAEAHFQLARVLRQAGARPSDIESPLLRVLQLDPRHAGAHYEWGLLRESDDADAASEAFRRAADLWPGFVPAHRALAELAQTRQDWPTVVTALEAVVAWEPHDVAAHLALGRALSRQKRWAEAVVTLRIASALDPRSAEALDALADALAAGGASDESARARRIARELESSAGAPR